MPSMLDKYIRLLVLVTRKTEQKRKQSEITWVSDESRQMPSGARSEPEVIASTKLSSSIATRYFGGHNDVPSGLSSQS